VSPCEECIHSDPALVEQILKNLLANAIKYTRPGGQVALRARRQSDAVQVEVADTGIGIAPDHLAYIYDEFYQVGVPTNSSREGYGLGLSIVQRLVKLLNLRLDVSSEVGKGSVFSLWLPRADAQAPAVEPQAPAPAQKSPAGRPRVLLVEDDPGVRDATRMLLSVEGYRVSAVASLAAALQSVQEGGPPDLMITDYHLGEGQLGTEVIAGVRAKLHSELKTVLMTGDTSSVVKHMADDPRLRILSKPIDAEQLLMVLKELLSA
jgi:two-component system, sensor histidine kinase